MDQLRAGLDYIRDVLSWLPDPLVALIILSLAAAVAIALHSVLRRLTRRLLAVRYPYLYTIVTRMRGLIRLGFIVLAMITAIPVAPLRPETTHFLARLLAIVIIAYIGWAVITALNITAGVYLRRFRLDVEDNLLARKHTTQVRVLLRTVDVLLVILTIAAALMTFQSVRQYGVSLFASAGVAGLVAGLAARPVLSNLFAGMQLAITQPIRLDDAVIVENEWGVIEEIRATYVVVRIWDLRRMVVPLTYFIEKPFQNWTRQTSELIGSAMIYVDYSAPVGAIRQELERIVGQSKHWNGEVVNLQVTDAKERTIELRAIMSANSSGRAFDLRCEVREKLIDFLQREHPSALPRERNDVALPAKPVRSDAAKSRSARKRNGKKSETSRVQAS
jgi:small-conductance mechanosensitive channel